MGRVLGQIYAYLYFSRQARNLAHMQNDLGISKGSASTIVRQLEQWHAVRRVWITGDRKDYYVAEDNFGQILRRILNDTVSAKIYAYSNLLEDAAEQLQKRNGDNNGDDSEYQQFLEQRLKKLSSFHGRTRRVWENPLWQRLLQ